MAADVRVGSARGMTLWVWWGYAVQQVGSLVAKSRPPLNPSSPLQRVVLNVTALTGEIYRG